MDKTIALLKKNFDIQLSNLLNYGCPEETIWELQDLEDKVLNSSRTISLEHHQFPFLPVLPKPYLGLARNLFCAKYGFEMQIDENEYRENDASQEPYYIIGVDILGYAKSKNLSEHDANFSEAISLSLFSGLPGPFFAHNSPYGGMDETGTWLNVAAGTTGPFRKKDGYPVIRSAARICKNAC